MNDNLQVQFAMYNPITDTIEVTVAPRTVLFICCQEFDSTVELEKSENIVYLHRLAKEQSLTYAKFTLVDNGLQVYVDAIN